MYLIIKLLQKMVSPLGVILVALFVLVFYRGRYQRLIALIALLAGTLPSMPIVADAIIAPLENYVAPVPLEFIPNSKAIVVLGGTTAAQWGDIFRAEELSGNRLLTAVRLYKLGKAPKILVTSGVGYLTQDGNFRTESDDMKDILIAMGVPETAIEMERQALNTEGNAKYSADLLKQENITEVILVTSSYHLQRADLWFKRAGLTTHPVGAGSSYRNTAYEPLDFIPSAAALTRSTAAIKEYLGLIPLGFKAKPQISAAN